MSNLSNNNGNWKLAKTVDNKNGFTATLNTAETYVDRDIELDIDVQAGALAKGSGSLSLTAGAGSATVTAGAGDSGSATNTSLNLLSSAPTSGEYYTITGQGSGTVNGSASGTVTVGTGGWIDAGTSLTSNTKTGSKTSNVATVDKYIKKAVVSEGSKSGSVTPNVSSTMTTSTTAISGGYTITANATGSYSAKVDVSEGYTPETSKTVTGSATSTGAKTLYVNKATSSVGGSSTANPAASVTGFTAASGTTPYYVTSTASGKWSANGTVSEGYTTGMSPSNSGNATAGAAVKTYIPAASFANTAASGKNYSEMTAPIIPSGGYLYINEGYTPAQKISLATLVPNDSTVGTDISSPLIHNTVTAYNNDGKLITGTMGNATVTPSNGTATATGGTASTSVTGMETTTTNTGYAVTASATGGSASVTASSVTASVGYVANQTTASTEAKSATGQSANQTKYIIAGSVTNNTTLPSGTTSSGTINQNSYIKVSKGYHPTDKYYLAQSTASGAKATVTSGSVTVSPTISYNSSTGKYDIKGSGTVPAPSVGTAGYISSTEGTRNTGTATINGTMNASTKGAALQTSTDTATYPSGYSSYRVRTTAGYTANNLDTNIPVYQGVWS